MKSEIKSAVLSARNSEVTEVSTLRNKTLKMIFAAVMKNNIFDRRQFHADVDQVLKTHQLEVTKVFKHGEWPKIKGNHQFAQHEFR